MKTAEELAQTQEAFRKEAASKVESANSIFDLLPGLLTALTESNLEVAIQLAGIRQVVEKFQASVCDGEGKKQRDAKSGTPDTLDGGPHGLAGPERI